MDFNLHSVPVRANGTILFNLGLAIVLFYGLESLNLGENVLYRSPLVRQCIFERTT